VNGGGKTPSTRRLLIVLAGALIALVVVWLLTRDRPSGEPVAPSVENEPPAVPERAPAPVPAAPVAPAPPPAPRPEFEMADDGIPIMPASPDARRPDGPVHPHPITPQHKRLFAENALVANLNGAMDVKDVPAMRRMLEEYRREYPEDDHQLQDGYAVIADCFEHPGAASRAAAERWIPTHNGSTLKRFVYRHCLEPQQP
jgi:hypothetical protein